MGNRRRLKELKDTPDFENFFMLLKEKKPIGMARLIELEKGIFTIEGMYIPPEFRGEKLSYAFLGKLIGRIKNKKARIYIGVTEKLINHYMEFGFVEVKNVPAVLEKRNSDWEVMDNKKYAILAYYKAQKKSADQSFSARPDLLVIDGGKGQLAAALKVLKKLGVEIPVISLAKRLEEIYMPGAKAPLLLEEGDEALKLLQRIRDESHRFAITFQRELHRKALIRQ